MANKTLPNLGKLIGLSSNSLLPASNSDGVLGSIAVTDLANVIGVTTSIAYKGAAVPSTNPGSPTTPQYYTFSTAGTYTNFLDASSAVIIVNTNEAGNLAFNGTSWTKQVISTDLSSYLPKSSIGSIPGNQLFDKTTYVDGFYINSSGVPAASAGFRYATIDLAAGQTSITISGLVISSLTKYYTFLDSANAVVAGSTTAITTSSKTITIPATAVKFRFTFKNLADATTAGDALMLNYGDTALTYEAYTPSVVSIDGKTIKNADKTIYTKTEVDALLPVYTTGLPGKNRADPSYILAGLVSSGTNGGTSASALWRCIVIPVTTGLTYTISGWASARTEIAFYKNAVPAAGVFPVTTGNLITSGSAASQGLTKSGGVCTFTAPALCTYVVVNLRSNTEADSIYSTFQLELGAAATSYEAFIPGKVIKTISSNAIAAGYLLVGGNLIPAANIATVGNGDLSEDELLVTLVPDNSGNTTIEYYLKDKRVTLGVVPYRPLNADVSTVFDFRSTKIDGTEIHTQTDEVAPYRIMGTTIAANHGYAKTRLTIAAHGKTNVDVGSVWTDGTNQWVIVNILDVNNLDVSSRTANTNYAGTTLTHVSGAAHTGAITGQTLSQSLQLYPVFKNRKLRVFADTSEVTQVAKKFKARASVTFAESYDVMTKASIMEWLITQVGTAGKILQFDGTPTVTVSTSYVFDKDAGCTIYTDFYALTNVAALQDIMFNMNNPLSTGTTYTAVKTYVPHSLPFTHETINYNFTNPTDISATTLATRIDFIPARCDATGIYCDRLLMLLTGGVGFALGYLPVKDTSVATRRTNAPNKALQISESKKTYMSAIDGLKSNLAAGDYFSTVAYKKYFLTTSARTDNYVVRSTEGIYLYADWHVATVDRLELPPDLQGKNYTVVQKSTNVTILTSTMESVLVQVTSAINYGYLILKF